MELLTGHNLKRFGYWALLGGLYLLTGACNTAFTEVQFGTEEAQNPETPDPVGSYSGFVYTESGGDFTELVELAPTPYRADETFCTSGHLPFTQDYSGYAQLSFSLNQQSADAALQPVETQGDGISLDIQNENLVLLQLQIDSAGQFWCTPLVAHNGPISIPFDAFLSECWLGGNHEPFRGNSIESVKVVVPPPVDGVDVIDFNICASHLDVYERTPCEFVRLDGGYYECDPLYGHAWVMTLDGTTTDVSDFSFLTPEDAHCISGELAMPYEATAAIGFNLAQDYNSPDSAPFEAMAHGVQLNFVSHNPDYDAFRLQLTGTVDSDFWCVNEVPTGGVSIPYESFRKECWGTEGDAYAKEPLSNISVQLVGDNVSTHPYNFCIESFGVY